VVIPQGFPKSVESVESRFHGFPCFPYSVIPMACFGNARRIIKILQKPFVFSDVSRNSLQRFDRPRPTPARLDFPKRNDRALRRRRVQPHRLHATSPGERELCRSKTNRACWSGTVSSRGSFPYYYAPVSRLADLDPFRVTLSVGVGLDYPNPKTGKVRIRGDMLPKC
jgi:hypothetical protein